MIFIMFDLSDTNTEMTFTDQNKRKTRLLKTLLNAHMLKNVISRQILAKTCFTTNEKFTRNKQFSMMHTFTLTDTFAFL